MTRETDLPCSECGSELVERTMVLDDAARTDVETRVRVAKCPVCGARFYPDETIARLGPDANRNRPRGDS